MTIENEPDAPSDFDFAVGNWHVRHRRLKKQLVDCTEWVEFDGQMSTRPVLGGFGNVEDNRLDLPDGSYRAIAVRSYDPRSKQWSIWWLDARVPDRLDVPVVGRFVDKIGTFYANDTLDGLRIRIRFQWFTGDPDHPRWEQAFSKDDGITWETNWTMDFRRDVEAH